MTQKIRWLAALALLLAFGARAAWAEEQVPPPAHKIVELLPAPRPASEDRSVYFQTPAMPPGAYPYYFAPPCPCPAPITAAAYAVPCNQGYAPFAVCPCAGNVCYQATPDDAPQYVVEAKLMKVGEDGNPDEVACPRLRTIEGQPATLQLHAVETPVEQSNFQMQMTVTKHGKGARLDMAVVQTGAVDGGDSGKRAHTETTETQCAVKLGEPHKMVLKEDADGTETAWVEVTVTEEEREQRACKGTCPGSQAAEEEDSEGSALDCAADFVDAVCDLFTDAASGVFGAPDGDEEMQFPIYNAVLNNTVRRDPQRLPPLPIFPLSHELAAQARTATACPACSHCGVNACGSASGAECVQCAAIDAVKKPALRIRIEAGQGRKSVEMSDGDKHWKASAARVTVQDGCVRLDGDVRVESCDDALTIHADTVRLERKDDGVSIHIDE